METHVYPEFPAQLSVVHVALFTQITSSAPLRARIIGAATSGQESEREAVNFAFVNARLITSALHLQTAIYQAVLAASQGSLRTKTVHSEVLWVLNPTNNITEAIRRYGVSDTTTALFVVRVGSPTLSGVQHKMTTVVQGRIAPLSTLNEITDWPLVKNYHKLTNEPATKNQAGNPAQEKAMIDNIVTSSAAMKTVTS